MKAKQQPKSPRLTATQIKLICERAAEEWKGKMERLRLTDDKKLEAAQTSALLALCNRVERATKHQRTVLLAEIKRHAREPVLRAFGHANLIPTKRSWYSDQQAIERAVTDLKFALTMAGVNDYSDVVKRIERTLLSTKP